MGRGAAGKAIMTDDGGGFFLPGILALAAGGALLLLIGGAGTTRRWAHDYAQLCGVWGLLCLALAGLLLGLALVAGVVARMCGG